MLSITDLDELKLLLWRRRYPHWASQHAESEIFRTRVVGYDRDGLEVRNPLLGWMEIASDNPEANGMHLGELTRGPQEPLLQEDGEYFLMLNVPTSSPGAYASVVKDLGLRGASSSFTDIVQFGESLEMSRVFRAFFALLKDEFHVDPKPWLDTCGPFKTPLHLAAFSGDAETCRAFLAAGADVGARCEGWPGWSPLHGAAVFGHAEVCAILLAAGADVRVTDNNGETPLEVAERFERETSRAEWRRSKDLEQVFKVLREHGA